MKLLSANLHEHLFTEIPKPLSSVTIISPYISKSTVEKLLKELNSSNETVHTTVITTFDRNNFLQGASSLEALQLLIDANITVYALKDLHTKLYIFNQSKCIIGSANFTHNGLNVNHELLAVIDNPSDVNQFVDYVNNLIYNIKSNGKWLVTAEKINDERTALQQITIPKSLPSAHSWGAKIFKNSQLEDLVLSVSAGKTFHLIEGFLVHSHPVKSRYNYRKTEFITFRQDKGGAMLHVYKISYTLTLNMWDWESNIKTLDIPLSDKTKLINYITSRIDGFGFDLNMTYKFYILEHFVELSNKPKPDTRNSPSERYYTLNTLINSTGFIKTHSKM